MRVARLVLLATGLSLPALLLCGRAAATLDGGAPGGAPAATGDKAEKADKVEAPRGNPPHADPAAELQRLRIEGLANFEAGITLKSALPLYEAALQKNPSSAIELFNLGLTQWKLKQPDEGRANVRKAQAQDPKLAQAPFVLGLMDKAAGDAAAAQEQFEKARALAPGDPAVHYLLGGLYKAAGREDAALQSFTDALALDPYHTAALYQIYQYHRRHGNEERAAVIFKEFSRLKRAASASRKEVNYEEGRLALPLLGAPEAPAAASAAGAFRPALVPRKLNAGEALRALDLRDVDGDLREDVIAVGASGRLTLMANGAEGFAPARALEPAAPGVGEAHSVLVEGFAQKAGPGVLVGGAAGLTFAALEPSASARAWRALEGAERVLASFDADHDGDLDLLTRRADAASLWLNTGAAEWSPAPDFFEAPLRAALGAADGLVMAAFAESDGVDLLAWNARGQRTLVRDGYGGRYDLAETRLADLAGLRWTDAADFDQDGRPDLVSLAGRKLIFEWNRGALRFESGPSLDAPGERGSGLLGDFDNDGDADVLIFDEGAPPLLVENRGAGRFEARRVGTLAAPALRQAPLAGDLDGDGRLDALLLDAQGVAQVWSNSSEGVGQSFRLRLEGLRSVPNGAATRVETRIGGRYQRLEARGRQVHVGLGTSGYAEILRLTWPNGFIESKFKVDAGRVWSFKESERVSGSCPTLFAWNGQRFGFVTDAFISGPLGVPIGAGRYFPVDRDEWIKIPGRALVPRDGVFELRLTEELREATYIDEVRLFALDHPADVQVFPNERLGPFPAPPELRVFGAGALRAPLRARDTRGRDVLERVRAVDGRYADGVVHAEFTGLAEPHWVELELPREALVSPHLRLYLTGWFYYFESTSLVALGQKPEAVFGWPEVQALVGGEWQRVTIAGVMPGKHKTLTVELGGLVPAGAERLRLFTNFAVYWDAIQWDATPPRDGDHALTEIALTGAGLRYRGFSRLERPAERSVPEHFDYEGASLSSLWDPLDGRLTRYGDVQPLVTQADDLLAVFSSGDELVLRFEDDGLPAPAPGWSRDYLIYFNGYVKDGDAYTAHARRVAPLPFKAMQTFPYDEAQLARAPFASPAYRQYLETYQTRAPLRFTGPRLSRQGDALAMEEGER